MAADPMPLDVASTMEITSARQVRDALVHRWPDSEYLHIAEAPQTADRTTGRRLDVLVLSVWASRNFGLDGVEIKVSVADWRRELKNAAKADWWFRHVNRFWIAAPTKVAAKILPELPDGWGLLACDARSAKELRTPAKHTAEPFNLTTQVGLLRAAADSGYGALQRADGQGYNRGYAKGKEDGRAAAQPSYAKEQLAELTRQVEGFTRDSGVDPREYYVGGNIGKAFKLATEWQNDPVRGMDELVAIGKRLDSEARRFERLAGELRDQLGADTKGTKT